MSFQSQGTEKELSMFADSIPFDQSRASADWGPSIDFGDSLKFGHLNESKNPFLKSNPGLNQEGILIILLSQHLLINEY